MPQPQSQPLLTPQRRHDHQYETTTNANAQLSYRPAGNGQTSRRASSTWPQPQAQTTEAAHLMSLWLSSQKSKNKTNQRTQKPKTTKNQQCDRRSKCERAGKQYTVKKCLCIVCLCLCACRASLTFVRSLTPEQVQKKRSILLLSSLDVIRRGGPLLTRV